MTISSFPGADDVVAGKLRVIRTLGVGGMGAVFEVEHTITKHRRALKLLHGEFTRSASVVARFLREASAAGRIGNAHVVETFDAGTLDSGDPYIVMELLEGRTLADEIAERGALPIGEACEILLQACDGIRAAHAAGVVHRDLKPDNLFLVKGARPFVKILDFGISKFDPELTGAHGLTQEGSALGTPFYMPPEQVRGEKDIGAQADVYALGVILYECLTADKPYSAETLPHLMVLIHEGRYAPPSMRRPELPPECDAVVATAMAGDRLKRYANIDELVSALDVLRGIGARLPDDRTLLVAPGPWAETAQHGTPVAYQRRPVPGSAPPPAQPNAPHASAPPPAPDASEPPTAGPTSVPAHTEGSFGHTQSVPARKAPVAVWVAVAMGVLVTGAVAFWVFGQSGASAESEPATPATESAPAAPTPVSSGPRAEVVVAPAEPPPSAHTPGATPKPERSARAAAPSASAAAPRSSSRARELGLSEENPFR
jgi:eukaryotic-like serine/threonine-protein kinase